MNGSHILIARKQLAAITSHNPLQLQLLCPLKSLKHGFDNTKDDKYYVVPHRWRRVSLAQLLWFWNVIPWLICQNQRTWQVCVCVCLLQVTFHPCIRSDRILHRNNKDAPSVSVNYIHVIGRIVQSERLFSKHAARTLTVDFASESRTETRRRKTLWSNKLRFHFICRRNETDCRTNIASIHSCSLVFWHPQSCDELCAMQSKEANCTHAVSKTNKLISMSWTANNSQHMRNFLLFLHSLRVVC